MNNREDITITKELISKSIKKWFREKGSKSTAIFRHLSSLWIRQWTHLSRQKHYNISHNIQDSIHETLDLQSNTIKKTIQENNIITTPWVKEHTIAQRLLETLVQWKKSMQQKFRNHEVQKLIYNLLQFDYFQHYNFSPENNEIFKQLKQDQLLLNNNLTDTIIDQYTLYTQQPHSNHWKKYVFLPEELKKHASMIGYTLLYNHIENLSFASLMGNLFWTWVQDNNIILIRCRRFQIILPSMYVDLSHWYDIMLHNLDEDMNVPIDITSMKYKDSKEQLVFSFRDYQQEIYDYNHHYVNYLLWKDQKPNFYNLYPTQALVLKSDIINAIEEYIPSSPHQTKDNNASNNQ